MNCSFLGIIFVNTEKKVLNERLSYEAPSPKFIELSSIFYINISVSHTLKKILILNSGIFSDRFCRFYLLSAFLIRGCSWNWGNLSIL
jgi:hypothetical protein